MKSVNLITLVLLIVGGLNWLLVGAFDFNLVGAILGGDMSTASRAIYVIVGLCALWQIMPFVRSLSVDEPAAQLGR
jgi:uncharacterized protein